MQHHDRSGWNATRRLARGGALLCALLCAGPAAARDIILPDRTQIPVTEHPARGELLVLWLASGFGSAAAEAPVARDLAARGIEVWQADPIEGRLLPPLESSLEQIPDGDIVALIAAARATGRRVLLLASARAGIVALRGARAWQAAYPRDSRGVAGILLLHPNLYLGPPEPGRDAEYHPAVARTHLPVFILQPDQSPWWWRLSDTRAALERAGAPVYTRRLSGVRDRFYFRDDATPVEQRASRQLAVMLRDAGRILARTDPGRATVAATEDRTAKARRASRGLQAYRGDPAPPPLKLGDLDGRRHDLEALRGRVVLVNFWATWCPPCVHEMPSMQRLREKLAGRPFEILAVNLGEPERVVREFLDSKVSVDFPVLMDRDGAALRNWKVFVFPTSYVIGPDGTIRLGAFGELEWDAPEVLASFEALLPESRGTEPDR